MFNQKNYYYYILCLRVLVYASYIPIFVFNMNISAFDIIVDNMFLTIVKNLLITVIECFFITLIIGIITEEMKMKLEIYQNITNINKKTKAEN